MKPKVVNIRDFTGTDRPYLYCGRAVRSKGLKAHPLANPFRLPAKATQEDRVECLKQYREWLDALPNRDELLQGLAAEVKLLHLPLGCWCAPKSCHADILAELIEPLLGD